jgi:hypothetical protein
VVSLQRKVLGVITETDLGPAIEMMARRRLDKLGLDRWAPGARNHFIRIVPAIVTGRRLRGAGEPHGD